MRIGVFLLGLMALGATCGAATLRVSTFTPDPGETIQLWVSGAPAGAEFLWDLDGDGVAERTTDMPRINWTVPQGAHPVGVTVKHQGKALVTLTALIVADPYIACWQTISRSGDLWEAVVTYRAKFRIAAPGLEITVPEGWGVEVVEAGNLVYKIEGGIHGFWSVELSPGDELTFRYRLHPISGGNLLLSGSATGMVQGHYYTVPIAGILSP